MHFILYLVALQSNTPNKHSKKKGPLNLLAGVQQNQRSLPSRTPGSFHLYAIRVRGLLSVPAKAVSQDTVW
jgi:hypothetical protein